ncbi:MAG TPA: hypothetical protein VJV23_13540 [Candidatus Polarisedimenticolia bacterium]|nr:hypothetical protein [Candidatus Polarisedimenticolia bacterium]
MIVDRTHRRWIAATCLAAGAGGAAYWAAARASPGGVRGGSAAGLAFGFAAAAAMAFEALLAVRKKRPAWRLGRASTWMRGHIWLGLLVVPLALFHSGFRTGGTASTWLLILLAVVTASGLFGLVLQQVLPRLMTASVEMETIYEQIPHVVEQLRAEAAERVKKAASEPITRFFQDELSPFLASDGSPGHRLGDAGRAEALFGQLRTLVPPDLHETVADLAQIGEERRQLAVQERLHRWLHGWLFVHVPLSWALLVLTAAHAVMTLSY